MKASSTLAPPMLPGAAAWVWEWRWDGGAEWGDGPYAFQSSTCLLCGNSDFSSLGTNVALQEGGVLLTKLEMLLYARSFPSGPRCF